MQICVLGSGSAGNCTCVSTARTAVLFDVGFGNRSLERRLRHARLRDLDIGAVFLTHGHTDHVSGVPALAAKLGVPVFLTAGTLEDWPSLAELPCVEILRSGQTVDLGGMAITPFSISHDAREPVGFCFEGEGLRGAVATDLGEITPAVARLLNGCDCLVVESNHDEDLLRIGPYPWALKQRLLSKSGHLSNGDLAAYLAGSFEGRARHIFLAHLSRKNNHPNLALESARAALASRPGGGARDCKVHLTDQLKPSIVLEL